MSKKKNRKHKMNGKPYGSNGANTPSTTSVYSRKSYLCHTGIIKVMKIGNVDVYAGSAMAVRGDFDWDLMLRLHNNDFHVENPQPLRMNAQADTAFPELRLDAYIPPIIEVTWPDFNAPDIPNAWWEALNKVLLGMGPSSIVIHCYGGHGRTGTALSILAGLNQLHIEEDGAVDPVAFVRKNYCFEAVESYEQVEYIKEVTGCKVFSTPAYSTYGEWWDHKYKPASSIASMLKPSISHDEAETSITPITTASTKTTDDDDDMKDVYARAVRYHHVAGDVYAEDAEGNLVNVGPDDGSYYGPAHKTAVM